MARVYEIVFPEEPPVGTVVAATRADASRRYTHTPPGWVDGDGILFSWDHIIERHRTVQDVTPLRTWDVPEEPPVGTKVRDREGDLWTRTRDGWTTLDNTGLYRWITILAYDPLAEVRE